MRILVTGGAGYIGSHTCVELLNAGYEIVVVDNLSNSSAESLRRVQEITGKSFPFREVNILDKAAMNRVFEEDGPFDAVIHFAAFKAVGESVEHPLKYYWNNITGTISLCEVMDAHNCKNIVFSSSATVYGQPKSVPIREDFPTPSATNPYGWTKLMMEQISVMSITRTTLGTSSCSAISTRSGLMNPEGLGKIPPGFRTTLCRMSRR